MKTINLEVDKLLEKLETSEKRIERLAYSIGPTMKRKNSSKRILRKKENQNLTQIEQPKVTISSQKTTRRRGSTSRRTIKKRHSTSACANCANISQKKVKL